MYMFSERNTPHMQQKLKKVINWKERKEGRKGNICKDKNYLNFMVPFREGLLQMKLECTSLRV